MSHVFHPDARTHGLADDCPRCAEHAEDPLRTLDAENLRRLVALAVERTSIPAGENEALAVAKVLNALEHAGKIAEVAPDLLERYLRERWHVPVTMNPVYSPRPPATEEQNPD